MPSKKPTKRPTKKRTVKVQITLPESLVRVLDKEVRRSRQSGVEASRISLMKELLGLGVVRRMMADATDIGSMSDARDSLLREAGPLAKDAALHEASGGRETASRLYLAAAARELEAISYMSPDDESGIKSALIMVIHHLKRGTGYRHLPEVTVASLPTDAVQ
jgi:hypothetical protein